MPGLKVAFVVQGEGRGHMTQALALASHLRDAGHEVVRVLLGRSPHRPVPAYFAEGISAPVIGFDAPTQVAGPDRIGLSAARTIADAVSRTPRFLRSIERITDQTADVDLVVNFLDLLGGIAARRSSSDVPRIAIAHNYLFLHPKLADAPGPAHVRRTVLAYANATAWGAHRTLALSFRPMESAPSLALDVMPPLLRPGLGQLARGDDGFLLAYALNPGYAVELARWQACTPGSVVHCYVEGGASALAGQEVAPGFHVHDLDDRAFLVALARCRTYVGSAGFESLCEAHHLGKPVLAVPTPGQFEQTLNAWDARRCGVARPGSYADLDEFWRKPDLPEDSDVRAFREWVARGPDMFVAALEDVVRRPSP